MTLEAEELDRGRQKKTWWDSVKDNMDSLGLSQKDAQFRNKRGRLANPNRAAQNTGFAIGPSRITTNFLTF